MTEEEADEIQWIEDIIETGELVLASQSDLVEMLSALRSFSAMAAFDFERAVTDSRSDDDSQMHKYTGWDQRHDDNKVQGRPIGGQWSDENVRYVDGIKTYVRG